MAGFTHYTASVGTQPDKFYKATLFHGDHQLVGINCFEPGQVQSVHDHADQDKVYMVMEGSGLFTVGDEKHHAGPGTVIWAPAGVTHGVENVGQERLVVLVCMAPPPQ